MFNKKKYIKHIICFFAMFIALCAFFAVFASAEQPYNSPLGSSNPFEYIYDFSPLYTDGIGVVPDCFPLATFQCDVDYVWHYGGWSSRVRATPTDSNTSFSVAYNLYSDYIYFNYGYKCSILFDYDGDFQYEQGGNFFNPVAFSITYDAYTTDDYDEYTYLGTYVCNVSSSFGYSLLNSKKDNSYTAEFLLNNVPAGCDAIKLKTITFSTFSPYSNDVYYLRGIGFCGADYSKLTYTPIDLNGQIPILVKARQTFMLPQVFYNYTFYLNGDNSSYYLADLVSVLRDLKSKIPTLTIDDCSLFVDKFNTVGDIYYILFTSNLVGGLSDPISTIQYLSFERDVGTLYSTPDLIEWRKGYFSVFQSFPYFRALNTSAELDVYCISISFSDIIYSYSLSDLLIPYLSRIYKNDVFLNSLKYDPTTYDRGYKSGYDNGKKDGISEGKTSGYANGFIDGKVEGFSKGYNDGIAEGYAQGYDGGLDKGYANGYDVGYDDGHTRGYAEGLGAGTSVSETNKTIIYNNGYNAGYKYGYADGYEIGYAQDNTSFQHFEELIITSAQSVGGMISDLLNFEVLGVNLLSLLGTILFLCFFTFILKKVL